MKSFFYEDKQITCSSDNKKVGNYEYTVITEEELQTEAPRIAEEWEAEQEKKREEEEKRKRMGYRY